MVIECLTSILMSANLYFDVTYSNIEIIIYRSGLTRNYDLSPNVLQVRAKIHLQSVHCAGAACTTIKVLVYICIHLNGGTKQGAINCGGPHVDQQHAC